MDLHIHDDQAVIEVDLLFQNVQEVAHLVLNDLAVKEVVLLFQNDLEAIEVDHIVQEVTIVALVDQARLYLVDQEVTEVVLQILDDQAVTAVLIVLVIQAVVLEVTVEVIQAQILIKFIDISCSSSLEIRK